jgi:LMBR1 domain-containing protein 1
VILGLAIVAGCIYVLIYFQHPEDKLVAWGPKVVVVSIHYL